jgi:Flp pilus assembly protein TadD
MERNMKHSTHLIVIVSALLTIAAVFPQQATANEASHIQYEMGVVGNRAFGDLVSKGDYQTAVNRINRRYTDYPFATATNLCAALSMLGEFDKAERHCNEAVKLADKSAVPAPRSWKGRNQVKSQQSLAYSNRGVLRVMSGDASGAEEDFQAAIERNANLHAAARNLARVQLEPTGPIVAKVSH